MIHALIKDNLKYNAKAGTLLWLNKENHATERPKIHRPKTTPPYIKIGGHKVTLISIVNTFVMENPTYRGLTFTHPTSIKQKYITLRTPCVLSKYAKEQIGWENE